MGEGAFQASLHRPHLVCPPPSPCWLLPARLGWSWAGCGSCQDPKGMRMLSHKSDFQARASLVPELGKADLTGAKTWTTSSCPGQRPVHQHK